MNGGVPGVATQHVHLLEFGDWSIIDYPQSFPPITTSSTSPMLASCLSTTYLP